MRKLASLIAKREGKKHQASIADIREILMILAKRESKKHQASIADIREILKILVGLEIETEGQVSIAINSAAIKILEKIAAKRKKVKK